jgi:predicted DNA-binding protein (MmcQ/YjbR family)
MTFDDLRAFCLSLPEATEEVQWGHDLLFKVGGKTFVFAGLEAPWALSIKCSAEEFAELIEREGMRPAPYLAQHKWVLIERLDAMSAKELKQRIKASYDAVFVKLPKKVQKSLSA